MKKNTVKLFILAAMLGGSLSAHAQSRQARVTIKDGDVKRLKELSQEFTAAYEAKHAEALRLAEINNWPLIIKGENGSISTLDVVRDGRPFYKGTNNAGSAITSRTNALQPGGSLGLNLTGEFADGGLMNVGIWDGGYPRSTHNDLTNRTVPGDADTDFDVELHPTHVTGTVIGDGSSASNAKGMATKATVESYTWNNDIGEMTNFAAFGGILSNHSYGTDASQVDPAFLQLLRGTYGDDARQVDLLMFDAPYYLPIFAAGNDNAAGSYDLLTDKSLAKNAMAVAAVKQVDNYTDASSVEITSFSSYGPSNDNRIKPDISSKGENVYSCSNTGNSAHVYENGTSMAAPGITGSLTLIQQYYATLHPSDDGNRNFMRSATLKALVAHSADEAGEAPGPDPIYGWGLMNAKRAAEIIKADSMNTSAKIQELILLPNAPQTFTVQASGTEPLIATLAWTDPAASAGANGSSAVTLINNLDIKITKGSNTYYPWRLLNDGSHLAANDAVNSVDNVEKVEVPGASGTYTVTISHKKNTLVNPNGSPEQAFSLIFSGVQNGPLGLNDINQKMFTVWPNPANNVLNITFGNGIQEGASAVFYDVQGRLVKAANLTNVDNAVDVQDLAKGIYVVSVTNGGKTEIEKVVIK